MKAVKLENLTLGYDRQPAVHHINGSFARGSLTAITGPNGAGKSTLLKGIAGILTPQEGSIIIAERIAYLPQAAEVQRDFPISVLQMAAAGGWSHTGNFRGINHSLKAKAEAVLGTVGLAGFNERQVGTLSSGQFQRALFARLILQDAQIILLDEPFTAIDTDTTELLLNIVLTWNKEGRTVLCVLHDLEQIRRHFPESLLLARDVVSWGKTDQVLARENLQPVRSFREAWQIEEAKP